MLTAHLTHVEHIGVNKWLASCDCGWSEVVEGIQRDARLVAEYHWLRSPLVT